MSRFQHNEAFRDSPGEDMDPHSDAAADRLYAGRRSRQLAALAYFLTAFSGLWLLVWRREDPFVRFHALQSVLGTAVFLLCGFVLWALGSFPIFGFLYSYLFRLYLLAVFVYWLFLMASAWRGGRHKMPFLGDLIDREFQ
jgi:uncharacterized membrane protein